MKPRAFVCAALLTLLTFGPCRARAAAAPPGAWTLDPQRSRVGFAVTKLGYADVNGRFTRFAGDVRFDPARPEHSSIRWRVRVASVETGERGRDQSLQTGAFFDASRFPELSFQSHRVRALEGGRLEVAGRITIKGRSRPLTIVAAPGPSGAGFETRFVLDRKDFDVEGGGMVRLLIGRKVRVHVVAVPEGPKEGRR